MTLKYIFYLITLALFTVSCKENNKFDDRVKYFENGKIKEKWFLGNTIFDSINVKTNNLEKKKIDSARVLYFNDSTYQHVGSIDFHFNNKQKSLIYFSNGIIERQGFVIEDTLAIGKWRFYTHKNVLKSIKEFKKIDRTSYLNQKWYYNKAGDTIGGNYYNLTYKDTLKHNEGLKLLVSLPISFFKNRATKIMACIPTANSPDFNNDYSNKSEINQACANDIETSEVNKKNVFVDNYNRAAVIQKKFKTSGNKLVRGIIYEYLVKEKDSLGLEKALENAHKMYFEIPVFVKDSV